MSNHAGGAPAWVTHDYLQTVLENIFDKSVVLKSYTVHPGSSVGDNYISQVLRIQLNYLRSGQHETLSVIGKLIPQTELGEMFNEHDIFGLEASVLTNILPRLQKNFPQLEPFSPRCFHTDVTHKVVFLEDLKEKDFRTLDQSSRSLDLSHCKLAIKTMATMHAQTYHLLQQDPTIKDLYLYVFWKKERGNMMDILPKGLFRCMLQVMDQWPIPERYKDKIKLLDNDICAAYAKSEESFNTLLHGDCWMNNMMYRYDTNGFITEIKFLDFQMCNFNSIGLDLNYFLFTSCDVEVLTDHLEYLLQLYFDTFVSVGGPVPDFTLDTVKKEFYGRLHFGMMLTLLFRALMLQPKLYNHDDLVNGKENENNVRMYLDKRCVQQVQAMLPFFELHGVF